MAFRYIMTIDGNDYDLGVCINSKNTTIKNGLCSTDFKSVTNTATITIGHGGTNKSQTMYSMFVSLILSSREQKKKIGFTIYECDERVFLGFLDESSVKISSSSIPENLTLTIKDKIIELDEKIGLNLVYENNTASSIISHLLFHKGISCTSYLENDRIIEYFVLTDDDSTTYREAIDLLLYELPSGVIYHNPSNDKYELRNLKEDRHATRVVHYVAKSKLNTNNSVFYKDGVLVKFPTVASRNQTVFVGDIPGDFDEKDGMYHGVKLESGDYYPADGDIKAVYQEYNKSILDRPYNTNQTRLQNSDLDLLYVQNAKVEITKTGSSKNEKSELTFPVLPNIGMTENPVFFPRKAWVLLRNDNEKPVYLDVFTIRGDAVFKEKVNKLTMPADAKNTEEYETSYIFNEEDAVMFASYFHSCQLFSKTTSTWTEAVQESHVGDTVIVRHKGTDYSQLSLVVQVDNVNNNGIRMFNVTAVAMSSYNEYASVLDTVSISVSKTVTRDYTQFYISTSDKEPVDGEWLEKVGIVPNGKFLWTRRVVIYTNGSIEYGQGYLAGVKGSDGSNGYSVYRVQLYKWSLLSQATGYDGDDVKFNFNTGAFESTTESGAPANIGSWNYIIPQNPSPNNTDMRLWTTTAFAYSNEDTDIIYRGEWSTPIVVSLDGTQGEAGQSVYTLNLYKRSTEPPQKPSGGINYNIKTGEFSGAVDGWQVSVPNRKTIVDGQVIDNGNCYIITAVVRGRSDTSVTIGSDDWSEPTEVFKDGEQSHTLKIECPSKFFHIDSKQQWTVDSISMMARTSVKNPLIRWYIGENTNYVQEGEAFTVSRELLGVGNTLLITCKEESGTDLEDVVALGVVNDGMGMGNCKGVVDASEEETLRSSSLTGDFYAFRTTVQEAIINDGTDESGEETKEIVSYAVKYFDGVMFVNADVREQAYMYLALASDINEDARGKEISKDDEFITFQKSIVADNIIADYLSTNEIKSQNYEQGVQGYRLSAKEGTIESVGGVFNHANIEGSIKVNLQDGNTVLETVSERGSDTVNHIENETYWNINKLGTYADSYPTNGSAPVPLLGSEYTFTNGEGVSFQGYLNRLPVGNKVNTCGIYCEKNMNAMMGTSYSTYTNKRTYDDEGKMTNREVQIVISRSFTAKTDGNFELLVGHWERKPQVYYWLVTVTKNGTPVLGLNERKHYVTGYESGGALWWWWESFENASLIIGNSKTNPYSFPVVKGDVVKVEIKTEKHIGVNKADWEWYDMFSTFSEPLDVCRIGIYKTVPTDAHTNHFILKKEGFIPVTVYDGKWIKSTDYEASRKSSLSTFDTRNYHFINGKELNASLNIGSSDTADTSNTRLLRFVDQKGVATSGNILHASKNNTGSHITLDGGSEFLFGTEYLPYQSVEIHYTKVDFPLGLKVMNITPIGNTASIGTTEHKWNSGMFNNLAVDNISITNSIQTLKFSAMDISSGTVWATSSYSTTGTSPSGSSGNKNNASWKRPAVIVESWKSTTKDGWYRVWSDGFIEQGGYKSDDSWTRSHSIGLTFYKPFTNGNYSVLHTPGHTENYGSSNVGVGVINKTTRSCNLIWYGLGSYDQVPSTTWYACGF